MIIQPSARRSRAWLNLTLVGVTFLTGLAACVAAPSPDSIESAEAIFSLPTSQIREAVVEVWTEEGYDVEVTQHDATAIRSGHRREIDSPWDWLLRVRFGVGRTQADAQITALNGTSSKLAVHVAHESKATFWNHWVASAPPLSNGAERYLRLVKRRLGVL
ncbi:hypothetical protein YTPLAS18_12250 [Nitrospira sp.]|nr:hypothetical protein YTPLAS18_12250 [Nitrospira sp.]